jgi:hypothetical protein
MFAAPTGRTVIDPPVSEDTRTGKFALMALGDNSVSDMEKLTRTYNLMIASDDVKPEALQVFRTKNPGAPVFCYFNTSDIDGDSPWSSYRRTWNDTNPHEDWFHHDASGGRVKIYYPKYKNRCAFDTGNVGLRDYLASRVLEIFKTGLYDGVQLDNVSTDYPFYDRLVGNWISAAPVNLSPEEWTSDEVGMLRVIKKQAVAAGFGNKTIIFNHMRSGEPEASKAYLAEIDGANCESWMSRSVELDSRWGWKAKVDQVREAAFSGKLVNLLCATRQPDEGEALFLFCSYLMAAEANQVFFFYATGYKASQRVWYPFYDTNLGIAKGEYEARDGAFIRLFTKGCAVVNPEKVIRTIRLNTIYKTLSGQSVNTLSLNPGEGMILLSP